MSNLFERLIPTKRPSNEEDDGPVKVLKKDHGESSLAPIEPEIDAEVSDPASPVNNGPSSPVNISPSKHDRVLDTSIIRKFNIPRKNEVKREYLLQSIVMTGFFHKEKT